MFDVQLYTPPFVRSQREWQCVQGRGRARARALGTVLSCIWAIG